jgi:hypothetical protein
MSLFIDFILVMETFSIPYEHRHLGNPLSENNGLLDGIYHVLIVIQLRMVTVVFCRNFCCDVVVHTVPVCVIEKHDHMRST